MMYSNIYNTQVVLNKCGHVLLRVVMDISSRAVYTVNQVGFFFFGGGGTRDKRL